jgi:hypothetical protein
MLMLMELEPLPSSISRLTIRINNGSSMIKTGVFKTHLTQLLELIPLLDQTEELFLPNQMDLMDKPVSIIPQTIK